MRFPGTTIPSNKTTYMCYNFVFPNDSTADIIAIEPVVDNIRIVHHMLLFGCSAKPLGMDFTIIFALRTTYVIRSIWSLRGHFVARVLECRVTISEDMHNNYCTSNIARLVGCECRVLRSGAPDAETSEPYQNIQPWAPVHIIKLLSNYHRATKTYTYRTNFIDFSDKYSPLYSSMNISHRFCIHPTVYMA